MYYIASEINNNFFTIERSVDAINWVNIGQINGAGNSNTLNHYYWIDSKPLQGTSYYRLKQTDYDGKFKYYDPKSANCDFLYGVIYTPNPFNQTLTIEIQNYVTFDEYRIIIHNSIGVSVFETKINDQKTILDLNELKKGVYTISLIHNNTVINNKIIKL